jgi:hypothetical protein
MAPSFEHGSLTPRLGYALPDDDAELFDLGQHLVLIEQRDARIRPEALRIPPIHPLLLPSNAGAALADFFGGTPCVTDRLLAHAVSQPRPTFGLLYIGVLSGLCLCREKLRLSRYGWRGHCALTRRARSDDRQEYPNDQKPGGDLGFEGPAGHPHIAPSLNKIRPNAYGEESIVIPSLVCLSALMR